MDIRSIKHKIGKEIAVKPKKQNGKNLIGNNISIIKKMSLEGASMTKMSEATGISFYYINAIREKLIEDGQIPREEKKQRKPKGEVQKEKKIEKEKRKEFLAKYDELRREAQIEDNKSERGFADVPTDARKTFLNYMVEASKRDIYISKKDMYLGMNVIDLRPDFANSENIKFFITNSVKYGGYDEGMNVIFDLMHSLRETDYHEKLTEYRSWMKRKRDVTKMKRDMEIGKEKMMESTEVGKRLGLTSAEVLILMDDENDPDFLRD